ncbi:RNA polymerase sigma-70 factor, ECF subfamily [Paramicrobacterium humi]|uniref:RNA polymerase sigma-70 factor, ECF subfamily n=1 Tax=Paramicrobacterium humi TaxID=640635 RepID=A0A1H4Q0D6_9MICO|nr:hypothetical protein [Microbacterium humi]SEC12892.1 RNA polymerase sigma-70 factor, ECF subfamily [Microbacterium humi]
MSFTVNSDARPIRAGLALLWDRFWDWLARPMHYSAVHEFRVASESGDPVSLAALLDPAVAVVVDAGEESDSSIRVVGGVGDAVALLVHGMAPRPGLVIEERSVNGQAGLMLNHGDEASAAITIDFTGHLISAVWIRLRAQRLRHWNHV